MRTALLTLALAAVPALPAAAQHMLQSPGAECQPTRPADAKYLDYAEGAANASGYLWVSCPLPAVPPEYERVAVRAYFLDFDERWGKQCHAYNSWPAAGPQTALIEPSSPTRPYIGIAAWKPDPGKPVHALVCWLMPGQTLYGLEIEIAPR